MGTKPLINEALGMFKIQAVIQAPVVSEVRKLRQENHLSLTVQDQPGQIMKSCLKQTNLQTLAWTTLFLLRLFCSYHLSIKTVLFFSLQLCKNSLHIESSVLPWSVV
jgi:hypothetical protein